MISLVTTRFNKQTWEEREVWLREHQWSGAIYGLPLRVKEDVKPTMIVLEMHNDDNEIKAISLVKKTLVTDKTYRIYTEGNFNRYIYKSRYRLVLKDMESSLTPMEKKIITIFNQLLFKGACHFKRQQGITAVPDWIMNNKYIDFIPYFKALFQRGCASKGLKGAVPLYY
jgi:hypothetical protein